MNHKYTQLPKSDIPTQGTWLLVQGDEEHLKRLLVERLRGQLLAAEDEFNLDQLDASERWEGAVDTAEQAKRERLPTRAEKILALAQALPFLGSGRLVIVRNADVLSADAQKRLAKGLESVPPMNHVLLVSGDGGASRKAGKLAADLLKGIGQLGTVYDCSPLNENEAMDWVRDTVKGWGQVIEPGAVQLLIQRAGTELKRLQIEVEKLSLMAGEKGRIRVQNVELLTPKLAEEEVFALVNAIAARDAARAQHVLHDLLANQREQPLRLLALITSQFRSIWQTKVLLDAGWRPPQEPTACDAALMLLPQENVTPKLKGWLANKLAGQARQLSWEQLAAAYQALLECDMAGKAIDGVPRLEPDVALEMLCAKLCAPVNRPVTRPGLQRPG